MKVIEDFSCLKEVLPIFKKFDCIVILAKYNYGKSSICTDGIHKFFGEDMVYYITFTDQSKPGFTPRKSRLDFNEIVGKKIIIFDELSDDKDRDVRKYLKVLIKKNKVIILSNPYGSGSEPEKEFELFRKYEKGILPSKTLFVYVRKGISRFP